MPTAKLYLVHCGFYDADICEGLFESHVDLFVAAESFETARAKVKTFEVFREKRMHVDGLQEIQAVQGFEIVLREDMSLEGGSLILTNRHRDLAPKPVESKEKAQ